MSHQVILCIASHKPKQASHVRIAGLHSSTLMRSVERIPASKTNKTASFASLASLNKRRACRTAAQKLRKASCSLKVMVCSHERNSGQLHCRRNGGQHAHIAETLPAGPPFDLTHPLSALDNKHRSRKIDREPMLASHGNVDAKLQPLRLCRSVYSMGAACRTCYARPAPRILKLCTFFSV